MTAINGALPALRPAGVDAMTYADSDTESSAPEEAPVPVFVRAILGALIIPGTLAVSVDAGWLSFHGVKAYLGDWQWPASLDGAIVVATLLRMFALTFRWRLPGATLFIWAGLGVTVAMNVESLGPTAPTAMRWAHGAEPLIYLFFVESLAWLLKMQLRLRHQSEARLTAMSWLVSPVVTSRSWLLMQRTGNHDPKAARAAIQRSIRARSQLLIICPSPWWQPIGGQARRARTAALQSIRDGLLEASQVVELLQENRRARESDEPGRGRKRPDRMDPIDLLTAVNKRALQVEEEQSATRRRRRPATSTPRREQTSIPAQRTQIQLPAAQDEELGARAEEERPEDIGDELDPTLEPNTEASDEDSGDDVLDSDDEDLDEDEDEDSAEELAQRAEARTVYLAYQVAGRRLTGPRLGELAGYSRRQAYRLLADFKADHGEATGSDVSDDTDFANTLRVMMADGLRLSNVRQAEQWRQEVEQRQEQPMPVG
jgi:hypothetical protein